MSETLVHFLGVVAMVGVFAYLLSLLAKQGPRA